MYYEILDIPLEQLERLKTLKVSFLLQAWSLGSDAVLFFVQYHVKLA